jgi:flagellar hook-associated protein 3 FlgL
MRVTQNMLNRQFLANLGANNQRLSKYQEMMATGKKLNKPSDDPVGVGYAMRYQSQISRNDQYRDNVKDGTSQLDFVDSTISQVNEIMKRARQLAVQGATETNSVESRQAIASEIQQLYEQLTTTGNTQLNGRYIFNGLTSDLKPYTDANAMYGTTDSGQINYSMSEGVVIQVNVSGNELFGDPVAAGAEATSDNAFAILKTLKDDLVSNNSAGLKATLDKFDSRQKKMMETWADVGARSNRLEVLDNRLTDLDLNLNDLLSKTEDADIPETITNLKMAEAVQRASLETGSRILSPSLVDFLR